jgi:hypothetical protein
MPDVLDVPANVVSFREEARGCLQLAQAETGEMRTILMGSPNPATGPIQMYHLGLWFNDPNDATKAGCPGNVTPFNGEHDAGIQVLNTSNFPALSGPLSNVP